MNSTSLDVSTSYNTVLSSMVIMCLANKVGCISIIIIIVITHFMCTNRLHILCLYMWVFTQRYIVMIASTVSLSTFLNVNSGYLS